MTFLPLISTLLVLPLVVSLQCYNFQTPADSDLTNVQKTTVVCPITARWCATSFQQTISSAGTPMFTETRGCADDYMCKEFIKKQTTGCIGAGFGEACCCMGELCNERME